jgi:hypothetical protein
VSFIINLKIPYTYMCVCVTQLYVWITHKPKHYSCIPMPDIASGRTLMLNIENQFETKIFANFLLLLLQNNKMKIFCQNKMWYKKHISSTSKNILTLILFTYTHTHTHRHIHTDKHTFASGRTYKLVIKKQFESNILTNLANFCGCWKTGGKYFVLSIRCSFI